MRNIMLYRVTRLFAAIAIIGCATAQPAPKPAFEVASVKRNSECTGTKGISRPVPGRIDLRCTTLRFMIEMAYGLFANGPKVNLVRVQIAGGPSWMETEYYDISAKPEGSVPLDQIYGPMLQSLLEERFQLKVHREDREMPAYILTVAKGGPKLTATPDGSCAMLDMNHLPDNHKPGEPPLNVCGTQSMRSSPQGLTIKARGITLAELTRGPLAQFFDRTIVDKTGLSGRYDVELQFAPEKLGGRGGPGDPGNPLPPSESGLTIFGAFQQQLGLKLEAGKGAVEVIVVDRAERPSEN
jgi:uncharacterized protein (TIGR03435 family)